VFSAAAGGMHEQLEQGDDEIVLSLDGVVPIVRDAVASIDARTAAEIPLDNLPAITVVRQSELPALWRGIDVARIASWALPIAALVVLAAAVAVARRRARTLLVVGVGVVGMAVIVVALLRVGRGLLSDTTGDQAAQDAFSAAWHAVTSSLVIQTLVLALFGVLIAVGGVLARSRTRRNRRPTGWA
jgi:anti-sigma-K factor RskA